MIAKTKENTYKLPGDRAPCVLFLLMVTRVPVGPTYTGHTPHVYFSSSLPGHGLIPMAAMEKENPAPPAIFGVPTAGATP
jgi:hypothetical protein